MDIIVLDANEQAACVIPRGLYFDDEHVEDLSGVLTYDFSIPGDSDRAPYCAHERLVIFTDLDGDQRLMKIKKLAETRAATHVLKVHTESAHVEMNEDVLRPTGWVGETPLTILPDILANTRYEVGQCDYAGDVLDFPWKDYGSALSAILALAVASGQELRYRAEFANNIITHRYVDLLNRRGSDTHKTIEYRKDTKSLTRTIDSSALVTALIGVGKPGDVEGTFTTFAAVAESDKPDEQDWIGDDSARQAFGVLDSDGSRRHRFGTFRDTEETSPTKLLLKTRAALADRISAAITYDVDAELLDRLPAQTPNGGTYQHEKTSLGDTLLVRDLKFNPPMSNPVRVSQISRSYADPNSGKTAVV